MSHEKLRTDLSSVDKMSSSVGDLTLGDLRELSRTGVNVARATLDSAYRWKIWISLAAASLLTAIGAVFLWLGSFMLTRGFRLPDFEPDVIFVAGFAAFAGAADQIVRARRATREYVLAVSLVTRGGRVPGTEGTSSDSWGDD
jgi:hypothetical protein